jgi:Domain of unknown function (DUF1330)
VVEDRGRYGIVAPSKDPDEDALRQCGLPHGSGDITRNIFRLLQRRLPTRAANSLSAEVRPSFEGAPPAPRVVVIQFESLEKLQALYESTPYKQAVAIGDKHATQRIFGVEGSYRRGGSPNLRPTASPKLGPEQFPRNHAPARP